MTTIHIAHLQIWENYGAHDWDGVGECPQYWKPKGGHEIEIESKRDFSALPVNDSYFRYDLIDVISYDLEEHLERVEKELRKYSSGDDLEYIKFNWESEIIFQKCVDILVEQGKLELTPIDPYQTAWVAQK